MTLAAACTSRICGATAAVLDSGDGKVLTLAAIIVVACSVGATARSAGMGSGRLSTCTRPKPRPSIAPRKEMAAMLSALRCSHGVWCRRRRARRDGAERSTSRPRVSRRRLPPSSGERAGNGINRSLEGASSFDGPYGEEFKNGIRAMRDRGYHAIRRVCVAAAESSRSRLYRRPERTVKALCAHSRHKRATRGRLERALARYSDVEKSVFLRMFGWHVLASVAGISD